MLPINPCAGGLGEARALTRPASLTSPTGALVRRGFGGQRPPIRVFPNNGYFSLKSVPFNQRLLDLLQKSTFAPPAPPILGGEYIQSPPELGSQCGLGVSPSRATGVDLGGIQDLCKRSIGDRVNLSSNDRKTPSCAARIALQHLHHSALHWCRCGMRD